MMTAEQAKEALAQAAREIRAERDRKNIRIMKAALRTEEARKMPRQK